ncbi:hypothetical protein L195_g058119 [Trifolium pratense]|uniref:Uncharacterized protein n=1 Tax=Trifolium pratense TaxID=57577 RepID=A0A2K3JQD7_TRIPR|nr:hypothetical protein L195_g058119 [Trifolium pratense]
MKGRRANEEGGNQGECGVTRRPKRVLTTHPSFPSVSSIVACASVTFTIWCATYLAAVLCAVRPSALIPTRQLPAPPNLSVTPPIIPHFYY